MILFFLSTLPSLPLGIYQTFVLEEKHGFNQTTATTFITDLVKGWAVAFALGGPFVAMFLHIVKWAGNRFVPWLTSFLSVSCSLTSRYFSLINRPCRIVFQLSMVVIYPSIIQPLFNKLSPLRTSELRNRIENLATKLKFPLKHLYEIDGSKRSSHSNAYFFGLPWVNCSIMQL
jgi:STE24 endopeptidase